MLVCHRGAKTGGQHTNYQCRDYPESRFFNVGKKGTNLVKFGGGGGGGGRERDFLFHDHFQFQ